MLKAGTILQRVFLCLVGALLTLAAWPANGIAPLLFIAFIPILLIEDRIYTLKNEGRKARLFGYSYLFFMLFNLINTWWIWNASAFGMLGAVLTNALIMSLVFGLFHRVHLRMNTIWAYVSLVSFWVAFEHLHMDWDLTWPWLNFGNGFAGWAHLIQWYEFTGTQGGTIWIWVVNICLFFAVKQEAKRKKFIVRAAILIVVPILLSLIRYATYKETIRPIEAVAVQPNIDPYNEKFNGMSANAQLMAILRLAGPLVTDKTNLVVCPETALPDPIWEEGIHEQPEVEHILEFIRLHPHLHYITGLTTYKLYKEGEALSATARKFQTVDKYYDAYNAAMQVSTNDSIQLYHKSRLVPGVEKMPFPKLFGYLDDFALDLGGTTGSLGVQEEPTVFTSDSIRVAPAICYESIYGDFLSRFVRSGANVICVISNDSWWGNTPGYRQLLQYARLRAIELRRSVIRSANTGTSCSIDQRGDVHDASKWWIPTALKVHVNLNDELTFYARFGDYFGRLSLFVSAVFIVIVYTIKRKRV